MEGVRYDGALYLELDNSNYKRYFFAVYDNGLLPQDKYVLIFRNEGLYTPYKEWRNNKCKNVLRKVFMP
ncbi:MAG: hypothetical protein CFE24_06890 [Flavobacterium sp. BFFFF2]|nr:MAG: hypothetical protein CFE24_06890 [Flavobacterium sp. BFFFF2]